MSAVHTTPAPAADAAGRDRRVSPLLRWTLSRRGRWLGGGALVASLLASITLAVWPASEVDKARTDGEQFGHAVAHLHDAQSTAEVDAALAKVHTAASDTLDHAGDAVAAQVNDQADALDRAVDGFVGQYSTDDGFEQDLYQAELDTAVDDLTSQADDFRAHGPDVQQAFWDGFDTGLSAA